MSPILALALAAASGVLDDSMAVPPSPEALAAAADYSERYRGQAIVVLFDGEVVFERYANGGGPKRLQMLASGSKSFVGLAAAAAIHDGLLKLDDPVCKSLTEWTDDPVKSKVTYRHLLTLTSGLRSAGRGVHLPGWEELAATPASDKPGRQFFYGAIPLNVFALALERRLGEETFEAYLERRVLKPAGMRIDWRVRCADGRPQVGGGAYATATDWAKFGEFVRSGGRADGKNVIDAAPIAECFKGTDANPAYGLTWWLRSPVPAALRRSNRIVASEWADAADAERLPADLVAALGAGKQRLYVIPSRKLVVVRQGAFPARGFTDLGFLNRLLNPPDVPNAPDVP